MTEPMHMRLADIMPAIKRDLTDVRLEFIGTEGERADVNLTEAQLRAMADMCMKLLVEMNIRRAPGWNLHTGEARPPQLDAPGFDEHNLEVLLVTVLRVVRLDPGVSTIDIQSSQNHRFRLVLAPEQVNILLTALTTPIATKQ